MSETTDKRLAELEDEERAARKVLGEIRRELRALRQPSPGASARIRAKIDAILARKTAP